MSVLQQVLTDARKLATRLRDHDSSAESLLSQAQGMFKQVESMKEQNARSSSPSEVVDGRSDKSFPSSSTSSSPEPLSQQPASPSPSKSPATHALNLVRTKRKHTVVFKYCEEMNELNEAANNRPRSALIHSIQQENRHIRQLQQENKELRLALEEHQNVMELIMSKYRQQVAKLVTVNAKHTHPTSNDQAKLAAQIERISEMVAVMRKAASLGDDESQQQQRLITALATENKGLREMLNIASRCGSVTGSSHGGVDMGTQTELDLATLEDLLTSTSSTTATIRTTNNHSADAKDTTLRESHESSVS